MNFSMVKFLLLWTAAACAASLTGNQNKDIDVGKYQLVYFDAWSRGEVVRWCFAFAGYNKGDYDDKRIPIIPPKHWKELKPKTPFGQLPLLIIDGQETIAQQRAVARYVAKRHGFAGIEGDFLSQAKVDMYVDGVAELQSALDTPARWNPLDLIGKKRSLDKFYKDVLSPFLDRYEGFVQSSGTGFLVCDRITLADLFTAEILDRIEHLYYKKHILKSYPSLQKLHDTVISHPNLKNYLNTSKTRRVIPFIYPIA